MSIVEGMLVALTVANAVVCCTWAVSVVLDYKRKYGEWPWKN